MRGAWSTESPADLAALGKEAMRQANLIGYLEAFTFFWMTAALAIPLVFLVRAVKRDDD